MGLNDTKKLNLRYLIIGTSLFSILLSLGTMFYNYNSYDKQKSQYKILISQLIVEKTNKVSDDFLSLEKDLSFCKGVECIVKKDKYISSLTSLKNTYDFANCMAHVDQVENLINYTNARFYIASILEISKRADIEKLQKNYYSILFNTFNNIINVNCSINVKG